MWPGLSTPVTKLWEQLVLHFGGLVTDQRDTDKERGHRLQDVWKDTHCSISEMGMNVLPPVNKKI